MARASICMNQIFRKNTVDLTDKNKLWYIVLDHLELERMLIRIGTTGKKIKFQSASDQEKDVRLKMTDSICNSIQRKGKEATTKHLLETNGTPVRLMS